MGLISAGAGRSPGVHACETAERCLACRWMPRMLSTCLNSWEPDSEALWAQSAGVQALMAKLCNRSNTIRSGLRPVDRGPRTRYDVRSLSITNRLNSLCASQSWRCLELLALLTGESDNEPFVVWLAYTLAVSVAVLPLVRARVSRQEVDIRACAGNR